MKKLASLLTAGTLLLSMATPVFAHYDASPIGNAPKVSSDAITIDGKMDETAWENSAKIEIDQLNFGEETQTHGTAYMLFDDNNLYISYDIKDADVVTPLAETQNNTPWITDSVEMFFDFGNKATGLVQQFRIDCAGYLSYYEEGGQNSVYGPDAKTYFGEYAVNDNSSGYMIEAAINLEKWGLQEGDAIGLHLQINDMTSSNAASVSSVLQMSQSLGPGPWDSDLYDYIVLGSSDISDVPSDTPITPEEPITGTCGESATWSVESSFPNLLRINGSGAVQGYDSAEQAAEQAGYKKLSNLNSVMVSGLIDSIGAYAFSDMNLRTLEISGVEQIGQNAFSNNPVTSISLSTWLTSIGAQAFANCTALTKVVIPASVNELQNGAFDSCTALKQVTFLGDVPEAMGDAFSNTPEDLTIYYYEGTNGWTSPTWTDSNGNTYNTEMIPTTSGTCGQNATWTISEDGVLTISGTGLIQGYETPMIAASQAPYRRSGIAIKSLVIEDGIEHIGPFAFIGMGLESVTIADSVLTMGQMAFSNIPAAEIILPQNLSGLSADTFAGCRNLTEITIPGTVNVLESGAFASCSSLEKAIFLGDVPQYLGKSVFAETAKNFTIYYHEGAEGWTSPTWTDGILTYNTVMIPAVGEIPSGPANTHHGSIASVAPDTISVDGVKDTAYADAAPIAVKYLEGQPVADATDSTANVYLMTNNGLLYVYAEINDTEVIEPVEQVQLETPWRTDSIEMFISANDIYQFRVDNTGFPSFYMNPYGAIYAYGPEEAKDYFVSFASGEKDGGYTVEYCIDLKNYGISSGTEIGINFQLNDMDSNDALYFIHNGAAGSWDFDEYDQITVGTNESYEAVTKPTDPTVMIGSPIGNVPYIKPDRIIIDGKFSSVWNDALTVNIDQFNYGDENAQTRGTAYMYWTEGKWYLFVDVIDADVAKPDPQMQANEPWKTDSVEMFFDFGHKHAEHVKQFRIDCENYPSYYEEGGEVYAYGQDALEYFDEYQVLRDDDGYNIEMVINLSKWGLEPGDEIGIQLQINDLISEDPYNVHSCWNMHQSMGAGSWDAHLYDYITLEAKEEEIIEEKPIEIPVTEDEETVSVKVEEAVVQGNTVTVSNVDAEALERIFDAPAVSPDEGDDGNVSAPAAPANTVTIDVSNVKSDTSEEAETVQQITIPAAVVDTIKTAAEKNNVEDAKLAVHLTSGSIILDKKTLDVINKTAEAEEGKTTTVSLVIDNAEDTLNENQTTALENMPEDEIVFSKLEIHMEVTKTDNTAGTSESEKIHDFEGGTVQLEVPFEIPEGMEESGFTVYYLDDNGNLTPMETQYSNGKIIWSTGHFSDYIILYKEPVNDSGSESSKEPLIINLEKMINDFCDDIREQLIEIGNDAQKAAEDAGRQIMKDVGSWTANHVKDKTCDLVKKLTNYLRPIEDDVRFIYNLFAD